MIEMEVVKKPWTKKVCDELIMLNKDNTSYFNSTITINDMYEMLRDRMRFGEAESIVIIAALIKAGAKFKKED